MNSSKLQNNEDLESKQEQLENKSEAIEPHELAGIFTDDQLKKFADALIALMKKE